MPRTKEVKIALHSMLIQLQWEDYVCFQEGRPKGHQDSMKVHQDISLVRGLDPMSYQKHLNKWEIFPKEGSTRETQPLTSNIWTTAQDFGHIRGQTLCPEIPFVHFAACMGLFLSRSVTLKDRTPNRRPSMKQSKRRLNLEIHLVS